MKITLLLLADPDLACATMPPPFCTPYAGAGRSNNECHWVVDDVFDENRSRIRRGDSPENFLILRQLALTILKRDPSKGSLKSKRFRAALNDDFRLQLVRNLHA